MHLAPTRSALTVRSALQLPVMTRGVPEVLTGHDALDRPIRWAHAGEIPDIASTLQGEELLLTTGMGIGRTQHEQERYIDDLADRRVVGLVIELGRRFRRLPPALVRSCERREMPLVVLHRDVRFIEIIEVLHRQIVDSEAVGLRRRDQLHRRFTELMLAGAGIDEVLDALAETINNPVVLEKITHGVLYHATHTSATPSVLAGFQAFRRGLPDAPRAIEQPLLVDHEPWGRLVALSLESPLDEFDAVAVERAVGMIAAMMLHTREEDRLARRERWNLLTDLLAPELDETEAEMRADDVGFAAKTMLAMAAGSAAPGSIGAAAWSLIWRDLERELADRHIPFIGGVEGTSGRAIVGLRGEDHRREIAELIARVVHSATERHAGPRAAAAVAVGRAGHTWSAMRDGLLEALQALAAAPSLPPRAWHDACEPDLGRLLWTLRESPELGDFIRARLAPLIEHDRQRNGRLMHTLYVYCTNGANKSRAARALHVERQSLYHRLRRIERLLGVDLDDGDTLLGLHLALRAHRILGSGDAPASGGYAVAHHASGRGTASGA